MTTSIFKYFSYESRIIRAKKKLFRLRLQYGRTCKRLLKLAQKRSPTTFQLNGIGYHFFFDDLADLTLEEKGLLQKFEILERKVEGLQLKIYYMGLLNPKKFV